MHADPRTDAQLVDALNGGDASAFDALYYRYRDWVVALAHRFTGHQEDALDVLQETFAYFIRKFPGFRLSARLTTFLYPVVKNLSIAARRKRLRLASDEEALAATPCAASAAPTDLADLSKAIASLNPGQREVVLMRFVDGLSMDEIAQALGIPAGTVKSRLHNALTTLRNDPACRRFFMAHS